MPNTYDCCSLTVTAGRKVKWTEEITDRRQISFRPIHRRCFCLTQNIENQYKGTTMWQKIERLDHSPKKENSSWGKRNYPRNWELQKGVAWALSAEGTQATRLTAKKLDGQVRNESRLLKLLGWQRWVLVLEKFVMFVVRKCYVLVWSKKQYVKVTKSTVHVSLISSLIISLVWNVKNVCIHVILRSKASITVGQHYAAAQAFLRAVDLFRANGL